MAGQRGREGDILQDVWLGMGGVGMCDIKKNLTHFLLNFFFFTLTETLHTKCWI